MEKTNGRRFYDESEIIKIRKYYKMGHHIIHLKSGQSLDIIYDTSNLNSKDSEKLLYWVYRKNSLLGYALSVRASIPRTEIAAIEYLEQVEER